MRTLNIINLTPHDVVIHKPGTDPIVVPKSGKIARCHYDIDIEETVRLADTNHTVDLTHTHYTRVINLPWPKPFTIYIVSDIVAKFMYGKRDDLYIVNGVIRKDGVTVACKSLGRL